ncbi:MULTISPECIES: hypothetical protein [unclassified Neptuniibacter]|uniref:hypothetical protein n=1 Tax=unclassified Neptuniibacter TaxID=2630693 RepID=UPI000C65CC06|nr:MULTISPECIES: hypothetical protein [unclassified Neptuniibacter]MAY42402.1 hypothetical protein [Oceanospirillaceae bacterium]|tara:strand:- start:25648 stop:25911 length:264 start_codon:yes stop_codon:yes gene_type:complete
MGRQATDFPVSEFVVSYPVVGAESKALTVEVPGVGQVCVLCPDVEVARKAFKHLMPSMQRLDEALLQDVLLIDREAAVNAVLVRGVG